MANNFNEYLRNAVLNEVFGGTTFSSPATLYLGLSSTAIADAGTGVTEPSGGGYERVSVPNTKASWTTASGATNNVSNAVEFAFPDATGDWGETLTHFFIADGSGTDANVLVSGTLSQSKTITMGDIARFPAGSLVISLDDN